MCNGHSYIDLFTGFFNKDWSSMADWATSAGLYAALDMGDALSCMRDAVGSDMITTATDLVGELVNGDGSTKQTSRRAKNKLNKGLVGFDGTTGNADGSSEVNDDPWNMNPNDPWSGWDTVPSNWGEVIDENTEKLSEVEQAVTSSSKDLVMWGKCAADIFKNFTKMQENYY